MLCILNVYKLYLKRGMLYGDLVLGAGMAWEAFLEVRLVEKGEELRSFLFAVKGKKQLEERDL